MTLRYAYGAAHPAAIRALVARYRRARAPLARSQAAWRRWLPQLTLGAGRSWLSRELQWNAYLLRSGTTYDEGCGAHLLSQGGYYQYDLGVNAAYRDPLQHVLPLVYAAPEIAREVVRYSAAEQPRGDGFIPYAMDDLCRPVSAGNSDDPARGEARRAPDYVEGRSVPATRSGRSGRELVFTLRARRGAAIDWDVGA
jgi:hypothetical protein